MALSWLHDFGLVMSELPPWLDVEGALPPALCCSSSRLGRYQPLTRQRCLRARCSRFVIFCVLVDLPNVVDTFAGKNVPRREHGGHHGVILIVVFVHSVAADQMQRRKARLQIAPDRRHMLAIGI